MLLSVIALCAAGAGSARAASSALDRVVTVSYQGSYHGTINYDEADLGTIVSDVSWDFEWTGTLAQLFAPADKVFTVNALTATETVSQSSMTCTVSFSENPATGPQTPVGRLLTASHDPADKVLIGVQAPIGGEDLISDNPACVGNGVEGAGGESPGQIQLEVPRPIFDLDIPQIQSQPFDGSWSDSDTISTSTSKFESTVTFGGCEPTLDNSAAPAGAARAGGKRKTPPGVCKLRNKRPRRNPKAITTDPKIKKYCKGRKKAPGQKATNPLTCEQWVYLNAFEIARLKDERKKIKEELAKAALWTPVHLLFPEPVSAPYAGWEGEQLVAKYGEVEDEIRLDYALVAKDPPDPATSSAALPASPAPYSPRPCPTVRARGAQRAARICAHDRLLFAASVQASRWTDSVLEAMIITANRHATAVHSGQSEPAAIQIATTRILEIDLAGALAAEQQADLRLARDLGAVGLEQILVQPLRAADLTTPDTTVTPTLVLTIVDALAAQQQLPAQSAAALDQATTALAGATTASESDQALAAFKSAADALGGPARLFLLAAERELAASASP